MISGNTKQFYKLKKKAPSGAFLLLLEKNNKIIKNPFKNNKKYDGIILAVSHNDFYKYTEDDFNKISKENLVLLDIKGVYSFATWKF